LGGPGGFRRSARFACAIDVPPPTPPEPEPPADDPLATAYAEGFAAGAASARAEAEEQARILAAARDALTLAFARLDQELQEELRLRLRDTVAALCEEAIAPLALDEEALLRRIQTAVAMLARADDERIIRLHPEDIALISAKMTMDWQVVPDALLERGGLRVESTNGGVEDGPAVWRRAIAEALRQC
jgi:flagellar assembly protein FliH